MKRESKHELIRLAIALVAGLMLATMLMSCTKEEPPQPYECECFETIYHIDFSNPLNPIPAQAGHTQQVPDFYDCADSVETDRWAVGYIEYFTIVKCK